MLTEHNRQEDCQFKLMNNIEILCKLKYFMRMTQMTVYIDIARTLLLLYEWEDVDTQDNLCYTMLQ